MNLDRIVEGGTVVTREGIIRADIGIAEERIAAVFPGMARNHPEAEQIDARGHLVLPGVIDVHVHLDLPVAGTVTADDYRTGTRAAARGGVTTLIDFATPCGEESMSQSIDNWFRRAEGKALVDYSFHATITDWERHGREINPLIARGFPSFKEYMIYPGLQVDEATISRTLEALKENGGLLMVHAESPRILDELIGQYHTVEMMKRYGSRLHGMSRPNRVEAEAVEQVVRLSAATGGPLYIVHLSTAEAVDTVGKARRQGVPVTGETCAQYLVFDESVFERPDGHLFATCPQVKKPADRERLWKGLQEGDVSVVATDTCTFTREQKDRWGGDWTRIPMGLPGLETLLPVVYTLSQSQEPPRLGLEEMCRVLSTNPARIMGLYPRKGVIEVGADADLVIVHPERRLGVYPAAMETNADWSPYEGMELAGFPRTTLSRGEVIVDDYKVVGKEGRGQWIPRRIHWE